MNKKDYVLIATVLKDLKEGAKYNYNANTDSYDTEKEDKIVWLNDVIDIFIEMLLKDNERFNKDKFINFINK